MNIILAILFGIIGMFFFAYGKNIRNYVFRVGAVLLMVYPYFVSDEIWIFIIGTILVCGIIVFRNSFQ